MPAPDQDLLAPAEDLAARLRGQADLGGVEVIVDRHKDLKRQIDAALAKASGAAILLSFDGWPPPDRASGSVLLDLRHSVSLWTNAVWKDTAIPAETLLGVLARAIHAYRPETSRGCQYKWELGPCNYLLTPRHQVYEMTASYAVVL